MPVVTLISDFGTSDYYLGAVKGVLLSKNPDVTVVDITHDIQKGDVIKAGYVVGNACLFYPPNTIHLISLAFEKQHKHVLLRYKDQYFIGPDSGYFSMSFAQSPEYIIDISALLKGFETFPMLHVYSTLVEKIIKGENPQTFGPVVADGLFKMRKWEPTIHETGIQGNVIDVDAQGNVTTNVTLEMLEKYRQNRGIEIVVRKAGYSIMRLSRNYSDVIEGEAVAVVNHAGFIELAINKGNFSQLMGLEMNQPIRFEFKDRS